MEARKAVPFAAAMLLVAAGCVTMDDQAKVVSPAPATAASASSNEHGAAEARAGTPLDRQWIFTRIYGFQGKLPPPPTNASLHLGRDSGRVVGTTSCNPISGSFEIDITTGKLRFENLENGPQRCKGTNGRTEEAVIQAMIATDAFVLQGESLSLLSRGQVVAQLVTP